MSPCTDRQETLWLDVHGELDPELRGEWGQHLEDCPACRQERKQLRRSLMQIKGEMAPPALSEAAEQQLLASIREKMHPPTRRWTPSGWLRNPSWRLAPGLAAAAVLVMALGWFGMQTWFHPGMGPPNGTSGVDIAAEDLEVIRNLDLLRELDALEKLVEVVDERKLI